MTSCGPQQYQLSDEVEPSNRDHGIISVDPGGKLSNDRNILPAFGRSEARKCTPHVRMAWRLWNILNFHRIKVPDNFNVNMQISLPANIRDSRLTVYSAPEFPRW
jgi:hypothetical protein